MAASPVLWVFDLDDTLYAERDYVRSALSFAGGLAADLFGKPNAAARLLALFAGGTADPIGAYWQEAGLPEAARPAVVAAMRAHIPAIALRPGAQAVLQRLRDRGPGFAIMTDGRSVTQRAKLRALSCLDARHLLISEETGWAKPDPRCYRFFADRLPGWRFAYVGDNPAKDFSGANEAGWLTVMLLDDGGNVHPQPQAAAAGAGAQHNIASWQDLGDLIDGYD
jgi:putative hydrolase of the HAD superfamily